MTSEFLNDLIHFEISGILMLSIILFGFALWAINMRIAYKRGRARGVVNLLGANLFAVGAVGSLLFFLMGFEWTVYFILLTAASLIDLFDQVRTRRPVFEKLAPHERVRFPEQC